MQILNWPLTMKAFQSLLLLTFIVLSYGHVEEQFKILSHSKLRSLYAKHYDGYKKFMQRYKVGAEDERPEPYRMLAYAKTVEEIKRHNKLYKQGKTTFKLGLNHMSDMTDEEFQALHPEVHKNIPQPSVNKTAPSISELPETVNWVERGLSTPVKKLEANCPSGGAAVAVAGAMEALYAVTTGYVEPLSAQQILDCTKHTCTATRDLDELFVAIQQMGGLNLESNYPWRGKQEQCKFDKSKVYGTMHSFLSLESDSVTTLKAAIAIRPVAVTILANTPAFKNYKEGIFKDAPATYGKYSHTMLAVGYGKDYILLKNSWGTDWGEKGYMRITTDIQANDNVCNSPIQPF